MLVITVVQNVQMVQIAQNVLIQTIEQHLEVVIVHQLAFGMKMVHLPAKLVMKLVILALMVQ